MLEIGCSPFEEDDYGTPAIIIAARKDSSGCVERLIQHKEDVNVVYNDETVEEWAKYHGNYRMMKLVGINPDNINIRNEKDYPFLTKNIILLRRQFHHLYRFHIRNQILLLHNLIFYLC